MLLKANLEIFNKNATADYHFLTEAENDQESYLIPFFVIFLFEENESRLTPRACATKLFTADLTNFKP